MALEIIPLTLRQTNELVRMWHRHHKEVQGHKFSIGCVDRHGVIHGAATVGRPVARMTNQKFTAEVTRLVTDGHRNACSILYAASARIAREMGFTTIQSFILDEETGISLKASGWTYVRKSGGGDWNRPSRNGRRIDQPQQPKQLWAKELNPMAAWKSYLNNHFAGCRKVAEGFDPHRHREVKLYAIPGEFKNVGLTDGTDSFIVPLCSPFLSDVNKAMQALQAGEDIGIVKLANQAPEGFKTRKRVVVGQQAQQELPLETASVRRRVTVKSEATRRRVYVNR